MGRRRAVEILAAIVIPIVMAIVMVMAVSEWHVNRGFDAAAETVPVSAIAGLKRPDALPLVLQEMETARALGIADVKAARRNVQIATRSAKAPGAVLHVLAIGVSNYGDKAKDLRLKFADRDAQDVASALINTQEGGIYAAVKPQFLQDKTASKDGIFDALAAMKRNMETGVAGGLAVIMFSGHGTMIDGQFYLVPYGADDSTPARLKSSALPATEFQSEILKLATHGRVLVLLDACRSAGLIGGAVPGADVLRSALAAGNVTVLTADKVSREDDKWQHGAFTKVFLDALSSGDDIDKDRRGVISMAHLTAYMAKHLDELTGGDRSSGWSSASKAIFLFRACEFILKLYGDTMDWRALTSTQGFYCEKLVGGAAHQVRASEQPQDCKSTQHQSCRRCARDCIRQSSSRATACGIAVEVRSWPLTTGRLFRDDRR